MLEPRALQRPQNRIIAYGSELASPLLRVLARARAGSGPTPPATWRRVVILGASHIGDLLYRTVSLAPLRKALPDAQITYVCAPDVQDLLDTNPDVDEVLPIARDGAWAWSRHLWSTLRARRFDAALCTNHIAYHSDLVLVTALGIPNRVAFAHRGFTGLATMPIAVAYPQPAPAYFRDMVAAVIGAPPDWPLEPVLHLTPADHAQADAALRELGLDHSQPIVACTMTTRQPMMVWPASRYLAALDAVARERPIQVVLCGSRVDAPVLNEIAATAPIPCRVLAGRLGLRAFGAFLARCDALLAPDSGPRHIANAVGTPVVFIRNLSVNRVETGSYAAHEIDATPSGEWLSLDAQTAVLARIDPALVASTLTRLLAARSRPGVA